MTLVLNAQDVERSISMPALIGQLEEALKEEAAGQVIQPPRLNIGTQEGFFRLGPVVMRQSGIMGYKAFHGQPKTTGVRYLVAVYEQAEGRLLALMDAYYLTAARTGAITGLATKYMSDPAANTVGVIGAGLEARTNLQAICAVRSIQSVKVFSPTRERREKFAAEMSRELQVDIQAVEAPELAVTDVDIALAATNTFGRPDPIAFRGAWIRPGMHVNSIGSTMPQLREVDTDTFGRADLLVVDNREGCLHESGDVIQAIAEGKYDPERVPELTDLVGGKARRRTSADQITVFKSVGTSLQDLAAGYAVYKEAVRRQAGQEIGEFLEAKFF